MLTRGRDQGRTTGAALGSCNGHGCTRNANGRGILNLEPSRFGVALEPLEIASKFGRGLVAQLAILLQQLADDVFQLGWYCRIQPYRRQRRSIGDTVADGFLSFSGDKQSSSRHPTHPL